MTKAVTSSNTAATMPPSRGRAPFGRRSTTRDDVGVDVSELGFDVGAGRVGRPRRRGR
jgi:hypothetical protein